MIYDADLDAEAIVAKIMAMPTQQVADNQHKLIGNYPNTYTYAKSLTEKALAKKKEDLEIGIDSTSVNCQCDSSDFTAIGYMPRRARALAIRRCTASHCSATTKSTARLA